MYVGFVAKHASEQCFYGPGAIFKKRLRHLLDFSHRISLTLSKDLGSSPPH